MQSLLFPSEATSWLRVLLYNEDAAALSRLSILTHPGAQVVLTQNPAPFPHISRSPCTWGPQVWDEEGKNGLQGTALEGSSLILLVHWEAWPGDTTYIDTRSGRKPRSDLILPLQLTQEDTEAQMGRKKTKTRI